MVMDGKDPDYFTNVVNLPVELWMGQKEKKKKLDDLYKSEGWSFSRWSARVQ